VRGEDNPVAKEFCMVKMHDLPMKYLCASCMMLLGNVFAQTSFENETRLQSVRLSDGQFATGLLFNL
jgi:hypothetical protein